MQIVRFEGGIEETRFGEDLFDADYKLKRIGMRLLPSGVQGFKTYWDLGMERLKEGTGGSFNISSRFWFYPVLRNVSVREDVAAIKGLKVGVFTEVVSAEINGKKVEDLSTFQNVAGDEFAKEVSNRFEELARVHPSFLRLQGLNELVALTKAIEEMDERPDLSFYLKDYRVKRVETKKEIKVLKRSEEYEVPAAGGVHRGHWGLSGGAKLMAIALRLKAGDVTALKEAVLKTRPKPDALNWRFVVGEWLIPTSPEMLKMEDIASLFFQAIFLQTKKYYDDAITLYGKIIEFKPDWDYPYTYRGLAYADKGLYDHAISDYSHALEINPKLSEVYNNRGNAYLKKGLYDQAISDYNKALKINPTSAMAYYNRGIACGRKGQYDYAISDFNKALEINPRDAEAYYNRGIACGRKGEYDHAISDFNKTLEINPRNAEAYYNRGVAYYGRGEYDLAIRDYNNALEINPSYAEAYFNKAQSCEKAKHIGEAVESYKGFIKHAPPQYAPYIERARERIRELEK
jgi:tetratricopeptide (TPR) repeat protein